jgi:hypothetical protein
MALVAFFAVKYLKKATIVVIALFATTPKKKKTTITSLLPSPFLLQLERRKKWAIVASLLLWSFV